MKKNNKRTTQNTTVNNPRSKLASESIFILLLTIGAVFFVSLITGSASEDPWTGGAELSKPVENSAGIFGAYLRDIVNGNERISIDLFLFLKFLFSFLIDLLLERSRVRVIFLLGNLYFLGKKLQISLKKSSFFLSFFDQAFSSEKTSILIIF